MKSLKLYVSASAFTVICENSYHQFNQDFHVFVRAGEQVEGGFCVIGDV